MGLGRVDIQLLEAKSVREMLIFLARSEKTGVMSVDMARIIE